MPIAHPPGTDARFFPWYPAAGPVSSEQTAPGWRPWPGGSGRGLRKGRLLWAGSLAGFGSLHIHRVEAIFAGSLTAAELGQVPGVTDPKVDDHHLTCAVRGSVAPLLSSLFRAGVIEIDSQELSLAEMLCTEAAAAAESTA